MTGESIRNGKEHGALKGLMLKRHEDLSGGTFQTVKKEHR